MENNAKPSDHLKTIIEDFIKENPNDPLARPYESEFFKSGKFQEFIKTQDNENR